MSESYKYEAYKKKLQGICDENNLVFRFRGDDYPISLTIRPVGGVAAQMNMLEDVEEKGYISPEAAIVFIYKDGELTYKTSETFTISDALFNKIKNLYKNMHYLWLQFFFRDVVEKIGNGALTVKDLPRIDEGEYTPGTGGAITEEQLAGTVSLEVDEDALEGLDDVDEDELSEPDEEIEAEGAPGDYEYEGSESDAVES